MNVAHDEAHPFHSRGEILKRHQRIGAVSLSTKLLHFRCYFLHHLEILLLYWLDVRLDIILREFASKTDHDLPSWCVDAWEPAYETHSSEYFLAQHRANLLDLRNIETDGMFGYSFPAKSLNSAIEISFTFASAASESEGLLTSSNRGAIRLGALPRALVVMFVLEVMLEARAFDNGRFTPVLLPLLGRGIVKCVGSCSGRLPLGFSLDCVFDGSFNGPSA